MQKEMLSALLTYLAIGSASSFYINGTEKEEFKGHACGKCVCKMQLKLAETGVIKWQDCDGAC